MVTMEYPSIVGMSFTVDLFQEKNMNKTMKSGIVSCLQKAVLYKHPHLLQSGEPPAHP